MNQHEPKKNTLPPQKNPINTLECRTTHWETNGYCQDGCEQKENFHRIQKFSQSNRKTYLLTQIQRI